eukprot:SAG11_NODE_677_length_7788_cov_2.637404_3_plen_65_part_00
MKRETKGPGFSDCIILLEYRMECFGRHPHRACNEHHTPCFCGGIHYIGIHYQTSCAQHEPSTLA